MAGKHSQAHHRQSKNTRISDPPQSTEEEAVASDQMNTHFKTFLRFKNKSMCRTQHLPFPILFHPETLII